MHRHVHRLAPLFAAFWFTLQEGFRSGCATARKRAAAAVKAGPKPETVEDGSSSLSLTAAAPRQKVTSISAIIPTINRYDYIVGSIDSLRNQTPRPDEIIVVDQTPRAQRRPEVYEKYADTEVRVIFLDSAGQSTSRNLAIEEARSEWCLFFEDDAEAWADCLAQHIDLLEASGADASTGVSLAPWKTAANIPVAIRHYHLADVLATGNCLARRSAILDVGGLDTAFDRGSGADHDLGARMYLRGHEVVFNPKAIETHFKAPSGGMRTYGAWWRNKTTMWAPYPPPTQIYTIHQYYPKRYWAPLYLHYFIQAGGRNRGAQLFWLWLSAPWKLYKAIRAAGRLTHQLGWQVGDREPGASRLQEKVPLR
jgi:GT2 family glycosyltransferase